MTAAHGTACDHVGIFSNNADRLIPFYCDLLGFRVEKDGVVPRSLMEKIFGVPSRCRLVKLVPSSVKTGETPAVALEIFQPLDVKVARRRNGIAGVNHWGMRVGDRRRAARTLRRKGVPVIEVHRNGHPVLFVRDPEGNRIELRD